MLLKCPECDLQVSDKALICPHCGYPLQESVKKKKSKSTKIKKLPNGFGRITKLKGQNLRNPYRVTVTVGKNEYGKPVGEILKPKGYFATYNDAYAALIEYHKNKENPFYIDSNITLRELYNKWSEEYYASIVAASTRSYKAAWSRLYLLYEMRAIDVKAYHIKKFLEDDEISPNVKSRIKSLFNLMFDYGVEHEILERNVARTFVLSDDIIEEIENGKVPHIAFTKEEMDIIWGNLDYPYVDVLLIQAYMGWRPQELGLIYVKDVDLDNWIIVGGMKTEAGRQRPVPVHPDIRKFIQNRYDEARSLGSEYLLNVTDAQTHRSNSLKMTYDKYRHRFDKIIKDLELNTNHRPHDPRKTCTTMLKKYKLDEYAIKYIIGHNIKDITEAVYTERDPGWLMEEMLKVPERGKKLEDL